ncbi:MULTISPECIES: hypothetical protein [Chryseobacterium]|uniref:hypothetical protein n=1 Tax=Chryseobacterium TaxID=59732 RepID=UPI002359F67E|nr:MULTISPECIES: hypothetical protein [unclassified Chryseobacterium]MDC8104636.1 hypothetical protein [Chryseobacterium sp. B21-037]MDQ1806176.1 hypothetical protein [Chryseobacterium sp. CKR4-1]
MIRTILMGTFIIALASPAYAYAANENPVIKTENSSEYIQQVPKTVIIKTKKFKIRIDLQPNGKYLYQAWGANSKLTSKPNMIISDGELVPDGSGGNYYYDFVNKGFHYQVWRNYLTDSATKAPYTLVVSDESGNTVVQQDGIVVKK